MERSGQFRGRYVQILTFFAGVTLRLVWWELILTHIGLRRWTIATRSSRFRREAVRFRALAIRMGGVMIKVGQFLSSRFDVLPAEVTDELAGLQDEVPAEEFVAIRRLAERELHASLEEQFEWLEEIPLAAASLGQVHRARLKSGEDSDGFREVVVKVQRPHIEAIVEVDLSALGRVGGWLTHYRPVREHADVPALLREFSSTVREEIDYLREAENAEIFFEHFREDPQVHVPRVVRSRTTRRVLTLENVYAIKITDYEAISAAGIDRSAVAKKLLDVYLIQIFEDGFVHADPHPGNLFVTPPDSDSDSARSWRLTFVDFGMTARVPTGVRQALREMVIGVGTKDVERVMRSCQRLGMFLPGADLKLVEQAGAQMFDRFWGMSMNELRNASPDELKRLAHQYRDLMFRLPFQIPQNLIMLGRTVAILSGMCTALDPDFNVWDQLAPYARKLTGKDTASSIRDWLAEAGELLQAFLALPSQAGRVLTQAENGMLAFQSPQIVHEVHKLFLSVNRLTGGILFAALLLGGIWLYNSGHVPYGQALLGLSVVPLLWTLFWNRD